MFLLLVELRMAKCLIVQLMETALHQLLDLILFGCFVQINFARAHHFCQIVVLESLEKVVFKHLLEVMPV